VEIWFGEADQHSLSYFFVASGDPFTIEYELLSMLGIRGKQCIYVLQVVCVELTLNNRGWIRQFH